MCIYIYATGWLWNLASEFKCSPRRQNSKGRSKKTYRHVPIYIYVHNMYICKCARIYISSTFTYCIICGIIHIYIYMVPIYIYTHTFINMHPFNPCCLIVHPLQPTPGRRMLFNCFKKVLEVRCKPRGICPNRVAPLPLWDCLKLKIIS